MLMPKVYSVVTRASRSPSPRLYPQNTRRPSLFEAREQNAPASPNDQGRISHSSSSRAHIRRLKVLSISPLSVTTTPLLFRPFAVLLYVSERGIDLTRGLERWIIHVSPCRQKIHDAILNDAFLGAQTANTRFNIALAL